MAILTMLMKKKYHDYDNKGNVDDTDHKLDNDYDHEKCNYYEFKSLGQ